ncbi:MAG: hypothetical protein KJ000_18965 [Pirellulaceae bacterium]|nr:hypothetical protein [Pirellulaceae bacterium]
MELKNAISVCLISLFSASLVVLVARSLDLQAASRLEPQLASIVEELRAIRGQGGLPPQATGSAAAAAVPAQDTTMVYYFHSSFRCQTCRGIEEQAHSVVLSEFADELAAGTVQWQVLNYEQPAGNELAKQFDISMPVVVLARFEDGKIARWKSLDQVWGLVGDKPAYASFIRKEIKQMLGATETAVSTEDDPLPTLSIPLPEEPQASQASLEILVPDNVELPIPE